MQALFEVAGGSITGTNHIHSGTNNQDAFFSVVGEQSIVAVVCDGCGSCRHSEVGAKLGARLVVEAIDTQIKRQQADQKDQIDRDFWQGLQQTLLGQLHDLAVVLSGASSSPQKLAQIVKDYLLFTIVGVAITPAETAIFSIGDGAIAINDKVISIESFSDNAPPYLAYGLFDRSQVKLCVHDRIATDEVISIALATDGIHDLIAAEEKFLPGKQECVGAFSQFWQQDRYFQNPDAIRRKLTQINRESIKPDWQERRLERCLGLLPDDTTLITIRRRRLPC